MRVVLAVGHAAGTTRTTWSGDVALVLLPLFLLVGALVVYCLVDLVRSPHVRYLPKAVWALVILFVSAPIGPVLYLALGRDSNARRADVADADLDSDVAQR